MTTTPAHVPSSPSSPSAPAAAATADAAGPATADTAVPAAATADATAAAVSALVARLDAVAERFAALAVLPATEALTAPDGRTGEQWRYGQAWAHVAEFPGYWTAELCVVLRDPSEDVPQFGRLLDDDARLAAVHPDRTRTPEQVLPRLIGDIRVLRTLLEFTPTALWERSGVHAAHGVMTAAEIADEFLVGHLEEHADQIAQLHES